MKRFKSKPRSSLKSSVLIASIAGIFSALPAFASPVVDPVLNRYLQPGATQDQSMLKVIAIFQDRAQVPAMGNGASYPMVRRALEENARISQADALRVLQRLHVRGAPVHVESLWLMNGMIIDLPASEFRGLMGIDGLKTIMSNRRVDIIHPVESHPVSRQALNAEPFTYGLTLMNLPQLRQEIPQATGAGVRVGILDTGIDPSHPDLQGKLIAFKDFVGNKKEPYDDHGHGTHVAGTIGGSSTSGTSIGVAPGVKILAGKVFTAGGSGTLAGILKGMQWISDPDGNPLTADAPALVSNSWGGGPPRSSMDPAEDPFCKAVGGWTKLGIFPVFAAGNAGPRPGTASVPGACPQAFAIGATDSSDKIASFSSRGPAVWKTGELLKPQVSAPGVAVISAKPGGGYQAMSGTSMATPHVAGLLALVYQAFPKATIEEAGKAVIKGVKSLGEPNGNNTFGFGRVDAYKTIKPALRTGLR